MQLDFIPFALPDIGEAEITAVADTMRSGWITTGAKTVEFERQFAAYLQTSATALAVNSATSGLHLALEACGIGAGDEVLIPVLTFTATAEVVCYLGAHPIFVDCDPLTLNIDISKLAQHITAKTKAIIPVHMAGLACDMPAILALAKQYNLYVIEDAAHALPSSFRGISIGQHSSDAIVFSFYATKPITTAEGGMIVSTNQNIIERCKIMRLHGINRDVFARYHSKSPAWHYEVVAPGFKYNLSDIASSIGIVQLARADSFWQRRMAIAQRYIQELNDLPLILPPVPLDNDRHSWHLFCCQLIHHHINRDDFITAMSAGGVGTSVHFIPLHLQPYYQQRYKLTVKMFPAAEQYFSVAVSLPIYPKMTDDQQTYIISLIKKILK